MANGNASESMFQFFLNWIYWTIYISHSSYHFTIQWKQSNAIFIMSCFAEFRSFFFAEWKIYAWRCVNCHSMLRILLNCMNSSSEASRLVSLRFFLLLLFLMQFLLRLYYLEVCVYVVLYKRQHYYFRAQRIQENI